MDSTSSRGIAAPALSLSRVAQARHRSVVDERGELPVLLVVARHDGGLQGRDHVRVVHVVLPVVHVLEQPALTHADARIPCAPREVIGVRLQILEIRTLDTALGALEAQINDRGGEAHDLKELRAAIARDGGDAHLGHDLEQTLADAAPVAAAELLTRIGVGVARPCA